MLRADEMNRIVQRQYSSDRDVSIYRDRANRGLNKWEMQVINSYMLPSKVLNIGCGGGRETFALETLGYEATGLDIVEPQIESAQATAQKTNSSAKFALFDGCNIPFPSEHFDAVTIWSQVLGNVAGSNNRVLLLQETNRVLKNSGILSLSVHEIRKTVRNIDQSEDYCYRLVDGGESRDLVVSHKSGGECYWHYYTSDELKKQCLKSGYKSVFIQSSADYGMDWDNLLIAVCKKN
jgi:ubiquinone/menaquinone biosynthesis C-methylase UbiE